MTRYGDIDYERLATVGFLVGAALFAAGAAGEFIGHADPGILPAWGPPLFTEAEALGIAIGFLAPLLFGVLMPLTE